jgi:hypothetical protein
MSEEISPRKASTLLLNLPGMTKITAPTLTTEDRKSAGAVFQKYAPLIAELGMEQIASGLAEGDKYGLEVLKVLRPAIFQNQATVVEVKNSTGSVSGETAQVLQDFLSKRTGEAASN